MSDNSANNKRIAKNTLFLYIRMLFIMAVSLYTSRVVLATLGAEDYGIYNIVGGVVVLFTFLNTSMIGTIQRFLNYSIGQEDIEKTGRVFSMSINCQLIILLIVFILSETIGLWFLNTFLNIPAERMSAANWIYQFSILTICVHIFYAPFNAAIISCEKMSIYAYISIFDVLARLGVVYILVQSSNCDKLILYGALLCIVSLLVGAIYICYCLKNFSFCHYKKNNDRQLLKKMMTFSGWSIFGGVSNLGATQGINMILNIFFGVAVNAAMGIANQVLNAIEQFVNNFSIAFNPQIIKSYAAGDKEYFYSLLFRSAKLCYFLMFTICTPVIICCSDILGMWLEKVPTYSVLFCQIILMHALTNAINTPMWTAVRANGNIKKYNIVTSGLRLSIIPISFFGFKLGFHPAFALWCNLFLNIIIQSWIIFHLKTLISLNIGLYIRKVVFPCFLVTIASLPIPIIMHGYMDGIMWTFLVISTSVCLSLLFVFVFGFKKEERTALFVIIRTMSSKRN